MASLQKKLQGKIIEDYTVFDRHAMVLNKTPQEFVDKLKKSVIGQDAAVETIGLAFYEQVVHANLQNHGVLVPFPQKNFLLVGPTGCGKTELVRQLEKVNSIPVFQFSAKDFSAGGSWKGQSFKELLQAALTTSHFYGAHVLDELAYNHSVVFVDEFDKVCGEDLDGHGQDVNNSIHNSILKLVEGTEMAWDVNTKDMMFVFGGSFHGLNMQKKEQQPEVHRSIGFGATEEIIAPEQKLAMDEIIEYGLAPELAGRIGSIVFMNKLEPDSLNQIMTKQNGIIKQFQSMYYFTYDIGLTFTMEAIQEIGLLAFNHHLGARAIVPIINEILNREKLWQHRGGLFEIGIEQVRNYQEQKITANTLER